MIYLTQLAYQEVGARLQGNTSIDKRVFAG